MTQFKLTPAQERFINTIQPYHKHICCYGGTGSGKTIMFLALLIMRAGMFPRSRHLIVRGANNTLKGTIINDFKKLQITNLFDANPWKINNTDLVITFANGSSIDCIGSDDEAHFRKVQGARYSTIYMNECSTLQTRNLFGHEGIMGRLSQGVITISKEEAERMEEGTYEYGVIDGMQTYYYEIFNRFFYDFNPPTKAHWTYKYFIENIHPITQLQLDISKFCIGIINPQDNPYSSDGLYEQLSEGGENSLKSLWSGQFQDVGGKFIQREYLDRKSTRLNSSHSQQSRMPSSA